MEQVIRLEARVRELEASFPRSGGDASPGLSDRLLEVLLKKSPAAIVVAGFEDGIIHDVSDCYCEMTGLSREELIGRSRETVNVWTDPGERDRIQEFLARGEACRNLELHYHHRNETEYTVLESAEIVATPGKRYLVHTQLDVSAFKKLERDLLKKNEELDAANEELGCIVEEMEATNEELNAVNEELNVSQEELRRNYEIGRAHV